jgi:hypothetical protein
VQQRHNQQGNNVDDFDQRVNRRTGRVFVWVTNGIAGYSRFVGF